MEIVVIVFLRMANGCADESRREKNWFCYYRAMRYPVAVVRTDEGYSVHCPGLPGCWSQGATEEEAIENIRDAIREYLEVARELASEGQMREVDVPV